MKYTSQSSFQTRYYRLSLYSSVHHFVLRGTILNGPLRTSFLPLTAILLKKYVPKIFMCQCYNEDNLPFSQELQNTETAHLLEHILLEFLCEEKLLHGADEAVFDGVTRWYKDSPQHFEILISRKKSDQLFFATALERGLFVFDQIIASYDTFLQTRIAYRLSAQT